MCGELYWPAGDEERGAGDGELSETCDIYFARPLPPDLLCSVDKNTAGRDSDARLASVVEAVPPILTLLRDRPTTC
ncbi:hypothetical protein DTW90_07830 [Neorhizobium sp. P12A]|nr:hypothetical protein DTW90_07830 [Neorhizobium sp. P12A]